MIDYVKKYNLDIEKYNYKDLVPFQQDYRWCHKYAYDVITNKITSCKRMKQAALRHFLDLQRDDIYFDDKASISIVTWFKFCPIIKGKNAGKPTILDPSQIFILCSLIGWRWKYDEFETDEETGIQVQTKHKGTRRYTQYYGQVSRKFGKTTMTAGLLLYVMYKHEFGPRVFSLATKKDQAKEVWNVAKKIIELSPRLSTIFKVRANDILLPSKSGEFIPLASESNSLDGLDPVAACLDECHAIKNRNLYGVLVSAFGGNVTGEYLMVVITTAGFILNGLCTDLYKNGCAVLDPESTVTQDNYFYTIFELDEGDDWEVERNWYKSNPGLVYGRPHLSYLRHRYDEALKSFDEKGNFLTKHCNWFVSGSDKWLKIDKFKKGKRTLNIDDYRKCECSIGFDRSQVSDITSASVLIATPDGGCVTIVYNLQSQGALNNAGDYLRNIYKRAIDSEDLDLVQGEHIRNENVKQLIRDLVKLFPKYTGVYYDPYHMKEIALDLEQEGITMVSVSMGPGNISEPAKKLEMLIDDGLFIYHDSILLEYAVQCALMSVSKFGNSMVYRDPNKVNEEKIDPLISTILALSGATLQKPNPNIYNTRGMLSLSR